MIKDRLKGIITEKGFLLTLVLALFCLFFFFGKLMINPNQVYFGATEDGMQAYYGPIYHIKHDTSYWHMNGMNYPYGDQVFFTGCQPFVSNPIKLISKIVDISDYTVGILNSIMLFSVLFSALCLYLIFKHLKLPPTYSAIAATGIAFLSPQIIRLSCHYSLTYQFAIPLFLLLLLKFWEAPSLKKSLLISFVVFFMTGTHFYFFGFFALISFFYWCSLFFLKLNFANFKFVAIHSFIQLILPFLLFQIILFFINDVSDRTNSPWGYLAYTANFDGVFYPSGGNPLEGLLKNIITPNFPNSMEGFAYVGVIGTICFLFFIIIFLKRIAFFEFKKLLSVTDNKVLNVFFWASIIALILSFGYPFIISGYEHWLQNVGLLKQMRGVARFSWSFYYIINIVAFYKIAQWVSHKTAVLKKTIFAIVLFILTFDAYFNTHKVEKALYNRIASLEDKSNSTTENRWLTEISPKDYQAIITLPYVHVGSENTWRCYDSFEIMVEAFIVSIKTGLPTTSSMMSRTSLSQTFKNIQLVLEPYRKLEIVNDFKNQKPFLVLVNENQINEEEKRFLGKCKKLKETPFYNVFELPFEALSKASDSLYAKTVTAMQMQKTYNIEGFNYTDSIKTFVYDGFNKNSNLNKSNESYYQAKIFAYSCFFFDTLPNFSGEQEYTVSFWMENFTEDLYPRATCVIECFEPTGGSYNKEEFVVGQRLKLKAIDKNWALIESKVVVKNPKDNLAISVWQPEILDTNKILRIRSLLIKPSKNNIYKENGGNNILFNNRTYYAN